MSSCSRRQRKIAIRPLENGSGNRTSSAGSSYKEFCELLDLSSLKNIRMHEETNGETNIETSNTCLVICQAKVTMEELVRYTLRYEKIPKVVAEFRNITVGGAISGAALESTSHLYGELMDTVAWVKVRTGKEGEMVKTFKGESLWCSLSGTYGSMGIVLEAALECVPAKPYVCVSYFAFDEVNLATKAIIDFVEEKKHVFLDGIIFPSQQVRLPAVNNVPNDVNRRASVVMKGEMVGNFRSSFISKRGWTTQLNGGSFYYEHVRTMLIHHLQHSRLRQQQPSTPFFQEMIPIEDYLFRYDYGAFWMARPMAFEFSKLLSYLPFIIGLFVASYRWVRLLTGFLFTTKNLFALLKSAPEAVVASRMVIQDCYIPPGSVNNFLSWVHTNIPLTTPIWLCPVRSNNNQPFTPSYQSMAGASKQDSSVMMNCGIYGRVPDGLGAAYTLQLEAKCQEAGGRKMLYAQNHYSEQAFWSIFDKNDYDTLRDKHSATDTFPSLFEKTCGVPVLQGTWKEFIISLFL